jgi:hypothetical protein
MLTGDRIIRAGGIAVEVEMDLLRIAAQHDSGLLSLQLERSSAADAGVGGGCYLVPVGKRAADAAGESAMTAIKACKDRKRAKFARKRANHEAAAAAAAVVPAAGGITLQQQPQQPQQQPPLPAAAPPTPGLCLVMLPQLLRCPLPRTQAQKAADAAQRTQDAAAAKAQRTQDAAAKAQDAAAAKATAEQGREGLPDAAARFCCRVQLIAQRRGRAAPPMGPHDQLMRLWGHAYHMHWGIGCKYNADMYQERQRQIRVILTTAGLM